MQKKSIRPLALGLLVLGVLARVAPHPPNFAPVGSLSLFAGARLRGWMAYLLPLLLMAVTDPLVGGYSVATPFVYFSFLLSVWIGTRLRASQSVARVGAAALIASAQFFVISNFGMWLGTAMYPHTMAGLAACYVNAIPFYGPTLAADVLYTGVLFGLHAWLSRMVATGEQVPQPA
jgi:hypothetical protein